MIDFNELDYKSLGARWRLVILAAFLLLVPIGLVVITAGPARDFKFLIMGEDWLNAIDEAVVIGAEIIAFYIVLKVSQRMESTKFGPGIGLLALGLFFLTGNEILWRIAEFEKQYLVTRYGDNAILAPTAVIYHMTVVYEHFFAILEGIFVLLAVFALRDIFEAVHQLEIEIDKEKTKQEVSKVVESDYFKRIRSEGIDLRRNREKN